MTELFIIRSVLEGKTDEEDLLNQGLLLNE